MDIDTTSLPRALQDLDVQLLNQAFTHRSLRVHEVSAHETNERLEFLGDAVLELCVSEKLYQEFPQLDEGILTRYRSALVRTESLATLATELGLGNHLLMSADAANHQELLTESVLANTFEAVFGALYVGKGYAACQEFMLAHVWSHFDTFAAQNDAKDPKTLLQELVQSQGQPAPVYTTIREEGPDHQKEFTVAVRVQNYPEVSGQGASKQKAQQDAAARMLAEYFSESH